MVEHSNENREPKLNKSKIISFEKDILRYQNLYSGKAEFEFNLNDFNGNVRKFKGNRSISEKNISFTLIDLNNNNPIQEPLSVITNANQIADKIVDFYKTYRNIIPKKSNSWKTYLKDMYNSGVPEYKNKAEILFAWLNTIEHIGLISTNDLISLVEKEFYKENEDENKFRKRISNINSEWIKKGEITKSDITPKDWVFDYSGKSQILFLNESKIDLTPRKCQNIQLICESYLTDQINNIIFSQLKEKTGNFESNIGEKNFQIDLRAFLNENIKVPDNYIPAQYKLTEPSPKIKSNQDSSTNSKNTTNSTQSSKNQNTFQRQSRDILDFFHNQIDEYCKDIDSNSDRKYKDNLWLIVNEIGMGKSTIVKLIFKTLAENYLKKDDTIPLFISAATIRGTDFNDLVEKNFVDDIPFLNFIQDACSIKKRKMVIIIDGMDEIIDSYIRNSILQLIIKLARKQIFIILTSRPVYQIKDKILEHTDQRFISIEYSLDDMKTNLGFPTYLPYMDLLSILKVIFQMDNIHIFFLNPLYIGLIKDFINKDSLLKDIPVPYHKVMEVAYSKLLKYQRSKNAPTAIGDITVENIIKWGEKVACNLRLGRKLNDLEYEIGQLRNIGLLIGDVDNPIFSHIIFQNDLIARAIADENYPISHDDVYHLIMEQNISYIPIGINAIEIAKNNKTLKNSKFKVFEYLFDDNMLNFTKIKAKYWKEIGKGVTPFVKELIDNFIGEKHTIENALELLHKIGENYPEFEQLLIEKKDIKNLIELGFTYQNFERVFKLLNEESPIGKTDTYDDGIPSIIFRYILQNPNKFDKLLSLSPKYIPSAGQLYLLFQRFPEETDLFYEKLILLLYEKEKERKFNHWQYSFLIHHFPRHILWNDHLELGKYLLNVFVNDGIMLRGNIFPYLKELSNFREFIYGMFKVIMYENDNKLIDQILRNLYIYDFDNLLIFLLNNPENFKKMLKLDDSKHGDNLLRSILDKVTFNRDLFEFIIQNSDDIKILEIISSKISSIINNYQNYTSDEKLTCSINELSEVQQKISIKYRSLISNDENFITDRWLNLSGNNIAVILTLEDIQNPKFINNHNFWRSINAYSFTIEAQRFIIQNFFRLLRDSPEGKISSEYILEDSETQITPELIINGLFHRLIFTYKKASLYKRFIWDIVEKNSTIFSDFIQSILNSKTPEIIIQNILNKSNMEQKFIDGFWKFIKKTMYEISKSKENDIRPQLTQLSDVLQDFPSLGIPNWLKKDILTDDNLIYVFIQIPVSQDTSNRFISLLQEIIEKKHDLVKKVILQILKANKNHLFYYKDLLKEILNKIEFYDNIFSEDIDFSQIFYYNILTESILKKLIRNKKFLNYLFYNNNPYNFMWYEINAKLPQLDEDIQDFFKQYLMEHAKDQKLMALFREHFPNYPIKWNTTIQNESDHNINQLENMGIDPDFDY